MPGQSLHLAVARSLDPGPVSITKERWARVGLNRETIKDGLIQDIVAEAERLGYVRLLSAAERQSCRARTLAAKPHAGPVWVFGYGSLIWNPAFHFAEQRPARLHGYHRAFCLRTHVGRGSPDCPGLVLGLDRGGSTSGLALRLDDDKVEEELDIVWAREMVTAAYEPRWVRLNTARGPLHAIAFVIDRGHDRYAGGLDEEETARTIAFAEGRLGPCRDYLVNTVAALDGLGFHDRRLHALQRRVAAIRAEETM